MSGIRAAVKLGVAFLLLVTMFSGTGAAVSTPDALDFQCQFIFTGVNAAICVEDDVDLDGDGAVDTLVNLGFTTDDEIDELPHEVVIVSADNEVAFNITVNNTDRLVEVDGDNEVTVSGDRLDLEHTVSSNLSEIDADARRE